MMNIYDFSLYIKNNLYLYLPNKHPYKEFEIKDVYKENNTHLIGIYYSLPTQDCNVSPVVYVDEFYDEYRNGKNEKEIIKKIADIFISFEENSRLQYFEGDFNKVLENIYKYNEIKKCLKIQLCDPKYNENLLKNRAYTLCNPYIALYFIDTNKLISNSNQKINVTKEMLKIWNIDIETLHSDALDSDFQYGPILTYLKDVVCKERCNLLKVSGEKLSECDAYILTNEIESYGASLILNKNLCNTIANMLHHSFYILPCSIHELIIIPKLKNDNISKLLETVHYANKTLENGIFLSNDIVLYNKSTGEFTRFSQEN